MPATALKRRSKLTSDDGTVYEVDSKLGEGGFGKTCRGLQLSRTGRPTREVCIKVCDSRRDWHGEAFFGELLAGDVRVVELLDAFVHVTGSGRNQRRRHVLVFEFMEQGTAWQLVEHGPRWTEAHVRREIRAILQVLSNLHWSGVTHRDLKPDNIYLRDGKLVLGDFGITRMAVLPGQAKASAFAKHFAPKEVLEHGHWWEAADVFHVGLLAASLLSGEIWWNDTPGIRTIAALPASDAMKSWIWHATGAKPKRYLDADDALEALDALRRITLEPGRMPRSLKGRSIVFTGRIDRLPRTQATQLATEMGDYELALKPLRAITLMDNPAPVTRPMALLWEAKIENARGNRAKAELWAKKALREDPNFAEAQTFLDELGG